jgi:hypothetical protein
VAQLVSLLWDRSTDELTVAVVDSASGDSFTLDVESAGALDAFHHPYAYASRSGVPFVAPAIDCAATVPAR